MPFYELFVNPETMEAILGKEMPDRVSTVEFYYRAGYDYVPAWPELEMVRGSLIDRSQGYPIRDWATFERYHWPDSSSIGFSEFETLRPLLPDGMKIIAQTGGIFEAMYTGMVEFEQAGALVISDDLGFKTQTLIAADDL